MREIALLLVLATPVGAQTATPIFKPSPSLGAWLASQPGPEAALDAILGLMNEIDQSNGLRPERLVADMDVLMDDIVSETTERVLRTDVDDDGTVSFSEFEAMNPSLDDAALRLAFAPYDPDVDGRADRGAVSAGERTTVAARLEASPLHEVAGWDIDGDGIARREEIGAVLAGLPSSTWAAK